MKIKNNFKIKYLFLMIFCIAISCLPILAHSDWQKDSTLNVDYDVPCEKVVLNYNPASSAKEEIYYGSIEEALSDATKRVEAGKGEQHLHILPGVYTTIKEDCKVTKM